MRLLVNGESYEVDVDGEMGKSQTPQQLNFSDRLKDTASVAWLVKAA